ncbi:MAG: hypothetical protein ACI4TM_08710 [Candidatus Cryptobacteroides sp.]
MTLLKATYAEAIPQAEAQMTIPTQNLMDLPEGAKYGTSNGRATVEVEKQGDKIVATSRCDSIARRCEFYERQAFRQQSTIDSLKSTILALNDQIHQMSFEDSLKASQSSFESQETKPPRTGGKWFAVGLAIGIALTVVLQLLWKRFDAGNLIKRIISKIIKI